MSTQTKYRKQVHVVLKNNNPDNPESQFIWEGTFASLSEAYDAYESITNGGAVAVVVSKNITLDGGTITAVRSVSGQKI